MTWQIRAAGVSGVIDADYETQYFLIPAAGTWWSFSRSTRIQQVDNYGDVNERLRPVGTGMGYIWNMCSVTRVAEIDGGSIVEIEAIALSRDVPGAIAWLANPIISRVSQMRCAQPCVTRKRH
jgi:hypothetical protein